MYFYGNGISFLSVIIFGTMFPKQRLEEGFSQRDQDSRVMEEPAVRNWGSPCGRDYYEDVKVASEDQQG